MTALVSSSSAFFLAPPSANSSHTSGILLNRSLSEPLHPHPSSLASSSSSQTSDSPSPSSHGSDPPPHRRIRFAPLPDPRRDLPVFYDSDSDPQPLASRSSPSAADKPPRHPPSPRLAPSCSLPEDSPATRSKSRAWGHKLLRPLLNPLLASDDTCPDQGNDSPDTLPLPRRLSTGSRAVSTAKESEHSQAHKDSAPLIPFMPEGSSAKGRKDGHRLLNGRIYGRRLSSADTQKHNQGTYEPEFVEWGYGGMGSVNNESPNAKTGVPAPDWGKLQSRGIVQHDDADPDADDGSGMGWVKRRRAQRDREKREKEEREVASQEKPSLLDFALQPESEDSPREPDSKRKQPEAHHVYHAVSIPAAYLHHVRQQSLHRNGDASGSVTPTSAPSLSRANSASSVPLMRTSSIGSHGDTLPSMPERQEESSGSSITSSASTSSSIDEEDEEVDTERESDEDEDDDVGGRLTSRGAGVEKISRHKE